MFWHRLCRLTAVSAVLIGCLSACNYTDYYKKQSGYNYGSRDRDDPKAMMIRSFGAYSADPRQHDNRYFEYSASLSRRIASLPGINTALVFLTDRNAYVGITTDWSGAGTDARGGRGRGDQINSGTMEGVYNVDNGSTQWDNRHAAPLYNSYFTHKDVSDLSSKLRQTVGDEIRRAHPRVSEVHISANREFVNQLVEFAKESWAGRPLAPLTPDFNRLVRYMFGMGKEIPLPLYERDPQADSAGGVGPEPRDGLK
ncbi:hypothetical protein GE107_05290 [Cohnella sp. CFH 77786]|uniref:hypothetical protein n=1 Tax=Cohnella sp. CFH 77786 TaxID=2662265 RepID=UPI001C60EBE1|nr:hypothetical protein [Cohnella sp. CFH 77786]MBW5445475.1 hypothetical protein [Cohnella sp. CFH 77786]